VRALFDMLVPAPAPGSRAVEPMEAKDLMRDDRSMYEEQKGPADGNDMQIDSSSNPKGEADDQ